MTTQRKKRQAERNFKPESVQPKTDGQKEMLEALEESSCVAAIGPAGTGKTFLAVAWATHQMSLRNYDRMILARPTLGVDGKTSGFLPGDLNKKLGPWMRSMTEILKTVATGKALDQMRTDGALELCSLEHIRGRTFDNSIMIIDEAQNTTVGEMRAFLTRIGENSKVIICGDMDQHDHRSNEESGLGPAVKAIDRGLISEAEVIEFQEEDVVRSKMCKEWGAAFKALGF